MRDKKINKMEAMKKLLVSIEISLNLKNIYNNCQGKRKLDRQSIACTDCSEDLRVGFDARLKKTRNFIRQFKRLNSKGKIMGKVTNSNF